MMSTAEVVDIVDEDAPVDEFDVKTNLLKQIDLSSSRRMRYRRASILSAVVHRRVYM